MFTGETSCLPERYDLAKKAGFKAVECAFPYEFDSALLKKVKDESGLEQVLINAEPGNALGYAALKGKESEFKTSLNKAIEYCNVLNCKL